MAGKRLLERLQRRTGHVRRHDLGEMPAKKMVGRNGQVLCFRRSVVDQTPLAVDSEHEIGNRGQQSAKLRGPRVNAAFEGLGMLPQFGVLLRDRIRHRIEGVRHLADLVSLRQANPPRQISAGERARGTPHFVQRARQPPRKANRQPEGEQGCPKGDGEVASAQRVDLCQDGRFRHDDGVGPPAISHRRGRDLLKALTEMNPHDRIAAIVVHQPARALHQRVRAGRPIHQSGCFGTEASFGYEAIARELRQARQRPETVFRRRRTADDDALLIPQKPVFPETAKSRIT